MEKLKEILAQVLRIEKEKITDELSPADTDRWDSMNALVLIIAIEDAFGLKLTTAEIKGIRCVGDIKKVLKQKGVLA